MIPSAELLSNFETCQRWGHWSRRWQRHRITPMEAFHQAVRLALVDNDSDPGARAGEHIIELASQRGLEYNRDHNLHRLAINAAAAADLIVTAIRQNGETWISVPASTDSWFPSVLANPEGTRLRRFLAVSHWGDDREAYEKHGWPVLGEISHFGMEMELVVAVIGPLTGGRRHSHWSKALFHPKGARLRFKLQKRSKVDNFSDSWQIYFREEHDEIDRKDWLQAMMDDGVLETSLFVVNVGVPPEDQRRHVRELAKRQLERLHAISEVPDRQLSTCFDVLHPCPFKFCCWSDPASPPSEDSGYDRTTP